MVTGERKHTHNLDRRSWERGGNRERFRIDRLPCIEVCRRHVSFPNPDCEHLSVNEHFVSHEVNHDESVHQAIIRPMTVYVPATMQNTAKYRTCALLCTVNRILRIRETPVRLQVHDSGSQIPDGADTGIYADKRTT